MTCGCALRTCGHEFAYTQVWLGGGNIVLVNFMVSTLVLYEKMWVWLKNKYSQKESVLDYVKGVVRFKKRMLINQNTKLYF